jgi:arsenate reductase (glutaredoxin)
MKLCTIQNTQKNRGAKMAKITVYEKPTCTTCRQVHNALKESGADFNAVNYYVEPISKSKLEVLVKKMGIKASELFRKNESIYKKLKLSQKSVSNEEAIRLMVKYPDLLQRPIVEKGSKAILARPADRLREIL